jgi:hypothetical protein
MVPTHAAYGTLEKLAVDCIEDSCQHDRAPLVDGVFDSLDSFLADFAAHGNGFVGTGLRLPTRQSSAGEPCAGADRPAPGQPVNPTLTSGLPRVVGG